MENNIVVGQSLTETGISVIPKLRYMDTSSGLITLRYLNVWPTESNEHRGFHVMLHVDWLVRT